MPDIVLQYYELSGWRHQLIFNEDEMAEALRITRQELRAGLKTGKYCYHAHPLSNALHEYQFNDEVYNENLRRGGL